MEQMGLAEEEYTFKQEFEKFEGFGQEAYNRAKNFVEQNYLNHDSDFNFLLSSRNPSSSMGKKMEVSYSFRKSASSIFNLAVKIDGLASAIGMTSPLASLIPTGVDVKMTKEVLVSKEILLNIEFD